MTMEEKRDFLKWAIHEVNLASETVDLETEDAMRQAYHLLDEYLDTVDGDGKSKAYEFFISLLKGTPLTPLEDREEDWNDTVRIDIFVHKRYPYLYKKSNKDGSFDFVDTSRFVLFNALTGKSKPSLLMSWYMNRIFPIEFPYTPESDPIRVYGVEFEYRDCTYSRIRAVSLPVKMRSMDVCLMSDKDCKIEEISYEEFRKVFVDYDSTEEEADQND